jgi:hypothetical protein
MEIQLNSFNKELKQNTSDFYDVITEPHYCIIRKLFSVPSENITEFEKKKMQNFLEVLNNEKDLLKKMESFSSQNFNFFRDVLEDENILRFLNMFSYDVYKTINNIQKFLDLIKKLKFPTEFLEDLFSKEEERKLFQEDSGTGINSTMTSNKNSNIPRSILSSFFLMGRDKSDRPIIGLELAKLIQENQKFTMIEVFHHVARVINKIQLKECRKAEVEQITIFLDIRDCTSNDFNDEVIKLIQFLLPSRVNKIYLQMSKSLSLMHNLKKSLLLYNLNRVKVFGKSNLELMKDEIDLNIINSFFITGQRKVYSLYKDLAPLVESKFDTVVSQSQITYDINQKDISHEISIQKGLDPNNKFLFNIETDSHTNEVCTILSKNLNNISWSNSHSIKIDSADIFSINEKKKDNSYLKTSNFLVEDFCFTIISNKTASGFVRKEIVLEKDRTPGCCSNDCRII